LGISTLPFEFSSVVSSTPSFGLFDASFLRAGDVENFELPGIAYAGTEGRKDGDVLADSWNRLDVL
jgi:hypothetical protein